MHAIKLKYTKKICLMRFKEKKMTHDIFKDSLKTTKKT